jgi:Protein of unknown function (DUF1592)/Protein of unknown function (DUF1588)/Protein of unknown function (DUF1587)/Protein of unknown function (DUF1595)/Protein of unknown function (DUF1585)
MRSLLWLLVLPIVSACDGQALLSVGALSGNETLPSSEHGGPGSPGSAQCTSPALPGRVTAHRLNRAEYDNSVRDLLGVDLRPAQDFPRDQYAKGFDNNADVLTMAPLLLEKYLAAADKVISAALSDTSARAALVPCAPSDACARQVLSTFVRRAFRRPVGEEDLSPFLALYGESRAGEDTFDQALGAVLRAVLVSPEFLFRIEHTPVQSTPKPHRLSGPELASRLSYFLWSSIPDDELLAAAEEGALESSEQIAAQVTRMLKSPKAAAFFENFPGQWLYTRALAEVQPDAALFPGFDAELREALRTETHLFFRALVEEEHSALALLQGDFTFVNERLARHYGLSGVGGPDFQRVELTDGVRSGVLTHGGFLTLTSHPNRTSPVKRGKWVLEQLLCSSPPPPPPNVEALDEGPLSASTVRDRLEEHRSNPACSGCHALMDPIGFGLEHFDAVGSWRNTEEGVPIDASGVLPGGATFDGARELGDALAKDPRFSQCLTEKFLVYALGRTLTEEDRCEVAEIAQDFEAGGYRLGQLIERVARSRMMTMRMPEEVRP